ncbi:MAG: hypothetical protein WBG50_26265, partial [Desulfomonilaceae bacterium]
GLRQLDQEALRGRIVSAALGSVAANPLDILKKLGERLKRLLKQSQKDDDSLWAIQSRMSALDKRLKELAQQPAKYSELKTHLAMADNRRSQIAAEIGTRGVCLQNLADLNRCEDQWRKLVSLDNQALELADARDFPMDGVTRLEHALGRKQEALQEASALEEHLDLLRNQLSILKPDMVLLEHGDSIRSLARDAGSLARRLVEIQQLESAIVHSNRSLDEEIASFGNNWNRERVTRSDPSLVLEEGIRTYIDSWRTLGTKIAGLEARLFESSERVKSQEEKIARKTGELARIMPLCRGYLEPEVRNSLQEWKEIQNSISRLDERLSDKDEKARLILSNWQALDEDLKRLEDERTPKMSPAFFWTLIAMLGAIGIGMVAFASLGSTRISTLLFGVGSCAILFSILVGGRKILDVRSRRSFIRSEREVLLVKRDKFTREIGEIENERRFLLKQTQELRQNLRQIAGAMLGNPDAGIKEVLEAEKQSNAAEPPFRRCRVLEDGLKADRADLEIENARRAEMLRILGNSQSEFETLKRNWDDLVDHKGLNRGLKPETALELVRRLRDVKSKARQLAEQERTLAIMKRDWEAFVDRVTALAEEMGRPLSSNVSPVDQVERWGHAEREASEALSEKKVLAERVKEDELGLKALRRKIVDAENHLQALMEAAGVDDEESFRQVAQQHERYRSIQQERSVLVENMISALKKEGEAALRMELQTQDWAENRRDQESLTKDLQRLREESEGLAREAGMLAKEIETLEAEDEMDHLLAEKEELLARFRDGVREWIVFKLSSDLLSQTVRMYESEKQPKLLARSSEIFSAVTGSSFKKVLFPLDGNRVKVERKDGTRIDEELLSRGTLEQLYLSMRLAHLDVHHRDKFNIPMMMDDVLVNFDPERARRTADALARFAEETGVQILFFTCHLHTADLFPGSVARFRLGQAVAERRVMNN